jgi:RNA 3'-terminal phosphate cyclase (ATP)
MLKPGHCLHVDGSILEGGGQVVRIATCLSALLGGALQIDKIRAGRSKPGLAGDNPDFRADFSGSYSSMRFVHTAQHATGIQLVAAMCSGEIVCGSSMQIRVFL